MGVNLEAAFGGRLVAPNRSEGVEEWQLLGRGFIRFGWWRGRFRWLILSSFATPFLDKPAALFIALEGDGRSESESSFLGEGHIDADVHRVHAHAPVEMD